MLHTYSPSPQVEVLYNRLYDLRQLDRSAWTAQRKREHTHAMHALENRINYLQILAQAEKNRKTA